MPYVVRIADTADLSQLVTILISSFYPQNSFNRWVYPLMRIGIYEDLKLRLQASTHRSICLVATLTASAGTSEPTDRIVGTVEVGLRGQFWQPLAARRPYIANLAVQANYRRQGVAQLLLHACEDIVWSWGFQTVFLHVDVNNEQAHHLYRKVGYRVSQFSDGWLRRMGGRLPWLRTILLSKQMLEPVMENRLRKI